MMMSHYATYTSRDGSYNVNFFTCDYCERLWQEVMKRQQIICISEINDLDDTAGEESEEERRWKESTSTSRA